MKLRAYDSKVDGEYMKTYKGYKIEKNWKLDYKGKRIPNTTKYMVVDEDDDWIGDVYDSYNDAKAYIDEITSKTSVKATSQVGTYNGISYGCEDNHNQRYYFKTQDDKLVYAATEDKLFAKIDQYIEKGYVSAASKKKNGTVRAWVEFEKWYNSLTADQRDKVDDIADEEGLPDYEECEDDALSWLKDEAEIVFKDMDTYDDMPEFLADRPYVFKLSSTNSTYNDDILHIVEEHDGIGVAYEMLNDEGTNLYANSFYNYAVNSKRDAKDIIAEVKKSNIPLPSYARSIEAKKIDWNRCYNIHLDDYYEGSKKIPWHSKFEKAKA